MAEDKVTNPYTGEVISSSRATGDLDPLTHRSLPRYNYPYPVPPRNVKVVHAFTYGRIDISWDNPSIDPRNGQHNIVGCNIYRSFDSSEGPYTKITNTPLTVDFYRDQSIDIDVVDEVVDNANDLHISDRRIIINSRHLPLVSTVVPNEYESDPDNIIVKIDGVQVRPKAINPYTGEIELYTIPEYDPVRERYFDLHKPTMNSEVKISYRYNTLFLQKNANVDQRIFYKVTAVSSEGVESPLDQTYQVSYQDMDGMTYYWANIISKQAFLLDHGGERAWLFIQKSAGERCDCMDLDDESLYGDANMYSCKKCYGTGFLGGFIGPFEVMLAPFDSETTYKFSNKGRVVSKDHETFLTNYPVVRQGDIIVRQNNERFVVGPVKRKEPNGVLVQQNFTIHILQPRDLRYRLDIHQSFSFDTPYVDKIKDDKRYLETKGKTPRFRNIHRIPEDGV